MKTNTLVFAAIPLTFASAQRHLQFFPPPLTVHPSLPPPISSSGVQGQFNVPIHGIGFGRGASLKDAQSGETRTIGEAATFASVEGARWKNVASSDRSTRTGATEAKALDLTSSATTEQMPIPFHKDPVGTSSSFPLSPFSVETSNTSPRPKPGDSVTPTPSSATFAHEPDVSTTLVAGLVILAVFG